MNGPQVALSTGDTIDSRLKEVAEATGSLASRLTVIAAALFGEQPATPDKAAAKSVPDPPGLIDRWASELQAIHVNVITIAQSVTQLESEFNIGV